MKIMPPKILSQNFDPEEFKKHKEICQDIYKKLKNWANWTKSLRNPSPYAAKFAEYCDEYVFEKTDFDYLERFLNNDRFDNIKHHNLLTSVFGGLKRFTSTVPSILKPSKEEVSEEKINSKKEAMSEEIQAEENILEEAKKLKKAIEQFINFYYKANKTMRVMDTRIYTKDGILSDQPVCNPDEELFPKNGHAHPDDVVQMPGHDDCYIMSALKSIVIKDFRAIEKCFVDFDDGCTTEEEITLFFKLKKVKIRIHMLSFEFIGNTVKITSYGKCIIIVDKNKLDPENTKSALWVHLLKKAIIAGTAKFKPAKTVGDSHELENINNNYGKGTNKLGDIIYSKNTPYVSAIVSAMVTGKSTLLNVPISDNNYSRESFSISEKAWKDVKERIGQAILGAYQSVTASSRSKVNRNIDGLVPGHQYYITSLKAGNVYLKDTMDLSKKNGSKNLVGRQLCLPEDDFRKYFGDVTVINLDSNNSDS